MKIMKLESLANELILDIFEYLQCGQLLRAFHGLNARFNELITEHFQIYSLDFRSILKIDFNYICANILPSIVKSIKSIHLSNDDNTPDLPRLFYSCTFQFKTGFDLKYLSLYYVHSINFISNTLVHCPHLIYLKLSECSFGDEVENIRMCINQIWNLSTLKFCYLHMNSFEMPTVTSSSIEYLTLKNKIFNLEEFISLIRSTPHLTYLNIRMNDRENSDDQLTSTLPLLTKLKLYFQGSFETLENLLENMPNLSELSLELYHLYIDGYQLEQAIKTNLKRLKLFRLLASYAIDDENIDVLLQSFETKFWLAERRWFVQCDYNTEYGSIIIYTLPYGFKKFHQLSCNASKSTCPTNSSFNRITYVRNININSCFLKFLIQFSIQFSNIRHIELSYPFENNLSSVILNFDRLLSLEIVSTTESDENDQSVVNLRALINNAINLYSLTIDYLTISQLSSVNLNTKSIRRLDLISVDGHFYGTECISLIHSIINNQCEILLINIENRSIIFDLMEKFENLRTLIFQCQDDPWSDNNDLLKEDDELILWLKMNLPSDCSIDRDETDVSFVRIWIR